MTINLHEEALAFFEQHKPDVIMTVQLIEKAMERGANLALQHATDEVKLAYEEQHRKVLESLPQS